MSIIFLPEPKHNGDIPNRVPYAVLGILIIATVWIYFYNITQW